MHPLTFTRLDAYVAVIAFIAFGAQYSPNRLVKSVHSEDTKVERSSTSSTSPQVATAPRTFEQTNVHMTKHQSRLFG